MENASSSAASSHQESFRRTKLCKFDLLGACTRGDECAFAHGFESLRPQPDLYRTRICAHFLRSGRCDAGSHCRYAHSHGELRPAPRGAAPSAELAMPGLLPQRKLDSPTSPPSSTAGGLLNWQQLRQRTTSPRGGVAVAPKQASATSKPRKKRSEDTPALQQRSHGGSTAPPLRAEVVNLHRALQSVQARADPPPTLGGPRRPGRQRERRRRPDRQERLCEEAERLRRRLRQKWEEAGRQRPTMGISAAVVQPAPGLVLGCTATNGAKSSSQSSEASSEPQGSGKSGDGTGAGGCGASALGCRSYLVKNTFVELEDDSASPACPSRRAKSAASRLCYQGLSSSASSSSGMDEDEEHAHGDYEDSQLQIPEPQPPTPSKLPLPVLLGATACPGAVWHAQERRQLPIKNTFEEAVDGASPQKNLRKCRSEACLGEAALADMALSDEQVTP